MRRLDARGAVFVEKLIVYLPMLAAFFGAWELAELGAAHLVVQRASAAAGRAAIVVLPDSPAFYDGEEVHSYSGQRRADVELAAGMILSAIPRLRDDFTVDVSDPPRDVGPIDVSVEANYDCGPVSMVCGDDGELTLTATTTHTYQGARYAYSDPASVGGSTSALADSGGGFRASKQGSGSTSSASGPSSGSANKDKKPFPLGSCQTKESGIEGVDFNADNLLVAPNPDGAKEYNQFIKNLREKLDPTADDSVTFTQTIQINGEKMTLTFQANNLYLVGVNGQQIKDPNYGGTAEPKRTAVGVNGAFASVNAGWDGYMNDDLRAIIGFTSEAARFGEVRNEFLKSMLKDGYKADLTGRTNKLIKSWDGPKKGTGAVGKSNAQRGCNGLGNGTGVGDPCKNLHGDGLDFDDVRP